MIENDDVDGLQFKYWIYKQWIKIVNYDDGLSLVDRDRK